MAETNGKRSKSKVEFLDLDALNMPLGKFKLDGVEYNVMPLTIKGFVNLNALPDELIDEEDDDITEEKMSRAVDVFKQVLPEVPEDAWMNLTVVQLNRLMTWVNQLGQEDVEKNSNPRQRTAARQS